MSLSDWTKILILTSVVIWIIYDAIAYYKQGNLPTESWTLKKWAFYMPGIALLFGILIGHLFFTFTPPERLCQPNPVSSK